MPKYVDPTRSPLWPRPLTPVIRHVEHWLRIDRLNDCIARFGGDAAEFVRQMQRIGGDYEVDEAALARLPPGRNVLFANHPLGGAEVIAALRILRRLGAPFRILANAVIMAPPSLSAEVVAVDNSETGEVSNFRELRRLVEALEHDAPNIFVFPAGHCSIFQFARGVADIRWKDTFLRLAQMSGAELTPIWFSGRNSVLFYAIGYLVGRLRSLGLPSEFFSGRRQQLVCRIGRPIGREQLKFFGERKVEALRAAVYAMADRPAAQGPADEARPMRAAPASPIVRELGPAVVDRLKLAALRRRCGLGEAWTVEDGLGTHVVVEDGDDYLAAAVWLGDSPRASPLSAMFEPRAEAARALQFAHLAFDPRVEGEAAWAALLATLRELAAYADPSAPCLGAVAVPGCDAVLAEAQFEFLRRSAPDAAAMALRPRTPTVPPSRRHDFRPARIRYDAPPSRAALSAPLGTLIDHGAAFGSSAWSSDGRPCIVLNLARAT